jgi:hypothetical protein
MRFEAGVSAAIARENTKGIALAPSVASPARSISRRVQGFMLEGLVIMVFVFPSPPAREQSGQIC